MTSQYTGLARAEGANMLGKMVSWLGKSALAGEENVL